MYLYQHVPVPGTGKLRPLRPAQRVGSTSSCALTIVSFTSSTVVWRAARYAAIRNTPAIAAQFNDMYELCIVHQSINHPQSGLCTLEITLSFFSHIETMA